MFCDGCQKNKVMVFPCPECPKHHCEECLQGEKGLYYYYCPDCRKDGPDMVVETPEPVS